MRVVVQRVSHSSVTVDGNRVSSIGNGMLVLAGFEHTDTKEDLDWMSAKIVQLRIFADQEGVMNLSVKETNGEILLISQFTLHAATKKGNRPSYIRAAPPEISVPLYQMFVDKVSEQLGKPVKTGIFGADMKVELLNDGPVTIIIDSKNKEF
ncbi:MAG: D-aminoacyl-tRNA deacylase [Prolixibacteraceae bacterium]|nr:D-aminoacyl-tRNA deacylase [Prolixibacteraceae bacterium]